MESNGNASIIGIVGGVGPHAGIDLKRKIFDNTVASCDQEHLEVYLLSCSRLISDRTKFLDNPGEVENPAIAIFNVIRKLHMIGADVIGIPCNTSHSPKIFDRILSQIKDAGLKVELLNMIGETRDHVMKEMKGVERLGLLATMGVYKSGVYEQIFSSGGGPEILTPDEDIKRQVHSSIYDRSFGIKAFSNPVKREAVERLKEATLTLEQKGAQAIIMGCTEIPLALKAGDTDLPLIDPGNILARALIRKVDEKKLKDNR
jgi:aspartate racemase